MSVLLVRKRSSREVVQETAMTTRKSVSPKQKRARHGKDCVCNPCSAKRKPQLDTMLERTAIVRFIQNKALLHLHANRRKDMSHAEQLAFKGLNYLTSSALERIAEDISKGEHLK